ncbi:hypothetical protein ACFHYQ_08060 [Sphaerimonospora cavernae]|uniref:Uncharacterized protein n=1 Tax=Sphaerimonospora cavernae TaxID=1740611 RepID=A0ABV6U1B5_9ACTN
MQDRDRSRLDDQVGRSVRLADQAEAIGEVRQAVVPLPGRTHLPLAVA